MAQMPDYVINVTPVTPADGDDYTWITANETPLTYAALVRTVWNLQNEMHGLAAQVVELRERLEQWDGDS